MLLAQRLNEILAHDEIDNEERIKIKAQMEELTEVITEFKKTAEDYTKKGFLKKMFDRKKDARSFKKNNRRMKRLFGAIKDLVDAAFKSQVRSERAFRTEDLVWQFDEVPGFAGRSIKSAPCVAKSSKYRCVQEGDNVVQILSQPDAASKSATETTKAASGTAHFSPGDRVRLRAGISSPRHGVPPGGRSSVGVITQNRSNQDIIIDFDDGTKW